MSLIAVNVAQVVVLEVLDRSDPDRPSVRVGRFFCQHVFNAHHVLSDICAPTRPDLFD